jgi:hypothetical protein
VLHQTWFWNPTVTFKAVARSRPPNPIMIRAVQKCNTHVQRSQCMLCTNVSIAGGPYRASPVGRCLVHMHCEQCVEDFLLTAVGPAGLQMPPCFACVFIGPAPCGPVLNYVLASTSISQNLVQFKPAVQCSLSSGCSLKAASLRAVQSRCNRLLLQPFQTKSVAAMNQHEMHLSHCPFHFIGLTTAACSHTGICIRVNALLRDHPATG